MALLLLLLLPLPLLLLPLSLLLLPLSLLLLLLLLPLLLLLLLGAADDILVIEIFSLVTVFSWT